MASSAFLSLAPSPVRAEPLDPRLADWPAVEAQAKGQTVYFNAWGGSAAVNAYLGWVGDTVAARYGVTLKQVKLDDTSRAVARVLAEKAAGKTDGGAVDLVWINGENFAAMKENGLLFGPGWADRLPNAKLLDHEGMPTLARDFTIPTDGMESPWGTAKLTFFYDSARTDAATLPKSTEEILGWAKANPGRFTYPLPPDFTGSSFLKQVLVEKVEDREKLSQPADAASFDSTVKPVFDYLDALHPLLWRKGQAFPANYPDLKQKLASGELDIIFAFNPAEASAAIAAGELPATVRAFTFPGGTLANTHFVAIPFNANAKAGAAVVANFLLSPEAQIRKQDPAVWGDPTVLALSKLSAADRAALASLDLGPATPRPDAMGPALEEPHPSWMVLLEDAWLKRYSGR